MEFYSAKIRIKLLLLIAAILIGIGSLWYSSSLTNKLEAEEQKKIKLWAEAVKEIQEIPIDGTVSPTLYKIIEQNKTIPVILTDSNDNIIAHKNLRPQESKTKNHLLRTIIQMKSEHNAITISFSEKDKNYVYFKDSLLLKSLLYYPYIQLGIIFLFILSAYFAFSNSRIAEQNKIWAGISKETAHQLGTPLSSLIAWTEYLKLKKADPEMIFEIQKDVNRLETITDRFSKIGSAPVRTQIELMPIIEQTVGYLKKRTSKKINYSIQNEVSATHHLPLNESLFAWVIENLCKNSIDAMDGEGKIIISVFTKKAITYIDIRDTGKGISPKQQKSVFKAGYTSKKRGWGLGLSLAKRIIEVYHLGKIFIKQSEPGKGTTFRIQLKNNP
ncbi:MAG: HAMP domain-containing sensor histidine kinase [Bacteroidota bacterium]|nr:HAMP domain-containing sensor histidine kinase [Bacteroidota bacterium]